MFVYPIHTVKQFKKTYKHHQVRLNELVFEKKITVIKGENGCGKSTLLKAMAGLIIYEGEIVMKGKTIYMHDDVTFPVDITLDTFFAGLLKLQTVKRTEVVDALIHLFSLDDKRHVELKNLSKGMKMKVNLITCLMEEAAIYLLDEPLSGLDTESVKKLWVYMKKSKEKQYILTSHVFHDTSMFDCDVVYL